MRTRRAVQTRFSQKLSNLVLWSLLTTHYETPKIQGGWDPPSWKSTWRHFFLLRVVRWDKISQTGAEWHVDCDDTVKIETRYRLPIWQTFGRFPWHVIPDRRTTLQSEFTWWIHCHDSRATCHIAGCNNSIRHNENRFSPYFIFFVFLMQFGLWLWQAAAFVSSSIHLFNRALIAVLMHNFFVTFYRASAYWRAILI